MQHYITDGYIRSRMQETERSLARAADQWTPPTRGPALRDRIGRRLVVVGASLVRDRAVLERLAVGQPSKAA